ncbi:MAG: sulfite exporter TauE/SafE family protein [bacterium]
MAEYFLYFLTGLLGSAHCVGMCGPIVLAYAVNLKGSAPTAPRFAFQLLYHLSYNLGRVLMWTFLGMVFALAGAVIDSMSRFEHGFAVAGGVLMLLFGLWKWMRLPVFEFSKESRSRVFSYYQKAFRFLIAEPGVNGKLALGLLNGLLPCGFSYAILVRAAVSGSPIIGGFTMLSFGLGTVPALFLTGLFSTHLSVRLRAWGERVAAILVVLLGGLLILRGLGLHLSMFHPGLLSVTSHGHQFPIGKKKLDFFEINTILSF